MFGKGRFRDNLIDGADMADIIKIGLVKFTALAEQNLLLAVLEHDLSQVGFFHGRICHIALLC